MDDPASRVGVLCRALVPALGGRSGSPVACQDRGDLALHRRIRRGGPGRDEGDRALLGEDRGAGRRTRAPALEGGRGGQARCGPDEDPKARGARPGGRAARTRARGRGPGHARLCARAGGPAGCPGPRNLSAAGASQDQPLDLPPHRNQRHEQLQHGDLGGQEDSPPQDGRHGLRFRRRASLGGRLHGGLQDGWRRGRERDLPAPQHGRLSPFPGAGERAGTHGIRDAAGRLECELRSDQSVAGRAEPRGGGAVHRVCAG